MGDGGIMAPLNLSFSHGPLAAPSARAARFIFGRGSGTPVIRRLHRSLSPRLEAELQISLAEVRKMRCECCGKSETDLAGCLCIRCESIRDDEVDADQ
jgi:hypothetical protein